MSIAKKTIFLSISNAIQVLISLLTSVGLAHVITDKSEYGNFQQIFVLMAFLTSVITAFPSSLVYFYGFHSSKKDRFGVIKRFFVSCLFTAIILGILYFFFNGLLQKKLHNLLLGEYVVSVSLIMVFRLVQSYFVNFFLLIDKLVYYGIINILYFLLTAALIYISYSQKFTIGEILFGIVVIDLIRFMLLYPFVNRFLWSGEKRGFLKKNELVYLAPVAGVAFVTSLNLYTDRFVISFLLEASAFADYQVGAFVFPFISIITGSVVTVLLPKIVSNYQSKNYQTIIKDIHVATEKIAVILLPIFIYCLIFGKELITFLYSDKYAISGVIFQIYTLRFLGTIIIFSMIMNAIGLEKWLLVNSVINLIVSILLNIIFVRAFGVMGAVYSSIIGTYIGYALPVYLVNKRLNTTLVEYFPIKSYIKILLISLLGAFFFRVLFIYTNASKVWAVIFSLAYYVCILLIVNKLVCRVVDFKKVKSKFYNFIYE